jgi:heterodisulfide reductase subunit D
MVYVAVPAVHNKEVNVERTEEALSTGANVIVSNCPFCMTMMRDGVKNANQEDNVAVLDLAELVAQAKELI